MPNIHNKQNINLNFQMDPEPEMMTQIRSTQHTQHTESKDHLSASPDNLFGKELEIKLESTAYATEFLPSDNLLCLGCSDGVTRVVSTTNTKVQYKLCKNDTSPVVGLACCPDGSSIKNGVMVIHASGTLQYWHSTSQQLLFTKKYETPLQSCQISNNGEWYAVSQENGDILLGHLNKGNPTTLETGHLGSHANRVFCIKWNPTDSNLFYSGGWDRAVFFWDVRTKTAVNKRFGYFIGGQAIDVKDTQILLGNNQNEYPLRIYDQRADQVRQVRWENFSHESIHSTTGVNSCCFGQERGQILALTSRNQLRQIKNEKCISLFSHDQQVKGYSMTSGLLSRHIVTAWSNNDIKVLSY